MDPAAVLSGGACEPDETRRLLYVALASREIWSGGDLLAIHRAELQAALTNRLRHHHGVGDEHLERWVGYLVVRRTGPETDQLGVEWGRDMIARITAQIETAGHADASS